MNEVLFKPVEVYELGQIMDKIGFLQKNLEA